MKKLLIVISVALALTGCERISQQSNTMLDGYAVRCIEGIKYVIVDDTNGAAITVLLKADGLPKECDGRQPMWVLRTSGWTHGAH